MNAFVFANTQNPKQQINGMNASFLPLAGRPLLIYVLMALDRVTQIEKVIVIGATKEIMRAIESVIFEIPFQKRIVVAEEKEYFLESVSFAEIESRKKGGVPDGLNMISEPALFLPGNIPFLTTAEVSRFILACDMTEADCYLSVIPGKPTSFFKAEQTQTDLADGEKQGLSLGRLLLAKCDAIGDSDAIKQIEQHYKSRKTDQIFHPLQLETLLKKINISPSEIEKQVSTLLKTRFKLTQCATAGNALCAEDKKSYQFLLDHFEDWRKHIMTLKTEEGDKICSISGTACDAHDDGHEH
ncbi:hypothetical protein MNBD_NITROSPIRAE01-763 [hydrothermal vent metagenome]|uniref:MobA-like NTP transferase domain-containing protein n=1 Tax=hydrothermal vent metagenome TaxID=652676 RepID=A0A3B1D5D4_9ZZZZ